MIFEIILVYVFLFLGFVRFEYIFEIQFELNFLTKNMLMLLVNEQIQCHIKHLVIFYLANLNITREEMAFEQNIMYVP